MIISQSVTAEYRASLGTVTDSLLTEFQAIVNEISSAPVEVQREALFDTVPDLGESHRLAASEVSATFFTGLAEMQGVPQLVTPDTLEPSSADLWLSLIGWGSTDRVLERGGAALMYSLIAGGLTRRMAAAAADTMIGNAEIQNVAMRSQRVPAPGCCAFCGMLASRFAGYTSGQSAGSVVGRGAPVERNYSRDGRRRRGGQARGIRARGSQRLGEDFHDHCRCTVVTVTEGNEMQLQADADRYYDQYRDAADKVNDGLTLTSVDHKTADGSLKSKYEWIHDEAGPTTAKSRTNMIVKAMRQELGLP